jgi:hypothetical protein
MMIGRKKTHEDNSYVSSSLSLKGVNIKQKQWWFVWLSSSSCLKGTIIRGENNDNHKWSSSFVFHRNIRREKKKHKDNGYAPWSSCLKRAETIGEDDNVSTIIIIFVFQRSNNKENKKDMKMMVVCHCLYVWEELE